MDSYPKHLTPIKDEIRAKTEPFQTWWNRVGLEAFPDVPRNVARHWIHCHWPHSPWGHIESRKVTFTLECWSSDELLDTVKPGTGFECSTEEGERLLELPSHIYVSSRYRQTPKTLANVMKRHGQWPTPIIVADQTETRFITKFDEIVDIDLLLIEGHNRFAMAQALRERGTIKPFLPVWVMRLRQSE